MHNRYTVVAVVLCVATLFACTPTTRTPARGIDHAGSGVAASDVESPTAVPATAHVDLASMQKDIEQVMAEVELNRDGKVYAAAVEGTNPEDLAIAVALVDGRHFAIGSAATTFPLMSVSKPFTYALAIEQRGADFMLEKVGVNATGLPYNSVTAGAVRNTSEQNPMVNAGAIATHSYIRGDDPADKTLAVVGLYSRMANHTLAVEEKWRVHPRALTYTLAYQMKAADRLDGAVADTVNRYLEANIVAVDVESLAQMGATLASGGTQPITGQRILRRETVQSVLSAMTIAGMYEDSGRWWTEVGVPSKSGVSGAILAVLPGWGAIAAYSPRLDKSGNSVRGAIAIRRLVKHWGLHTIDRLMRGQRAAPGQARIRSLQGADNSQVATTILLSLTDLWMPADDVGAIRGPNAATRATVTL